MKSRVENLLKIGEIRLINGKNSDLQNIQIKTLRNLEDAYNMSQFGFNSKAPVGSRAVVAEIGNEKIVIANEHISSIIDVKSGDTIVYNQTGSYIKLVGNTIEIKANNINIISSSLTHNGTNIGDSHTHGGVQAGSSNTTPPN